MEIYDVSIVPAPNGVDFVCRNSRDCDRLAALLLHVVGNRIARVSDQQITMHRELRPDAVLEVRQRNTVRTVDAPHPHVNERIFLAALTGIASCSYTMSTAAMVERARTIVRACYRPDGSGSPDFVGTPPPAPHPADMNAAPEGRIKP